MLNFNVSINDLNAPKKRIFNAMLKKYQTIFDDILNDVDDDKIKKTTNTTQDEVVKGLQSGTIKYDKNNNKFYGRIIGQALIEIKNRGATLDRRDGKYKLDFNKLKESWRSTISFLLDKNRYNRQILSRINARVNKINENDNQDIMMSQADSIYAIIARKIGLQQQQQDKKEFAKLYKKSIHSNYDEFVKNLTATMRRQTMELQNGAILSKTDYKLYCRALFNENKKYVEATLREVFFDNLKYMCEENDTEGFYWYYEWPLETDHPCLEHMKNCIDSIKHKKKFIFKEIQRNVIGKKWHSILPGYHKGCRCSFASEYRMLPISSLKAMENYYKKHVKK